MSLRTFPPNFFMGTIENVFRPKTVIPVGVPLFCNLRKSAHQVIVARKHTSIRAIGAALALAAIIGACLPFMALRASPPEFFCTTERNRFGGMGVILRCNPFRNKLRQSIRNRFHFYPQATSILFIHASQQYRPERRSRSEDNLGMRRYRQQRPWSRITVLSGCRPSALFMESSTKRTAQSDQPALHQPPKSTPTNLQALKIRTDFLRHESTPLHEEVLVVFRSHLENPLGNTISYEVRNQSFLIGYIAEIALS